MPVIGSTITQPAGNEWPTDNANTIIGGFHTVGFNSDRDSIPLLKRTEGMLCYVVSSENTWQLKGGIENDKWVLYAVQGIDWQDSVIDRYNPTPGLPTNNPGDRYVATATANGWTIHNIYEGNGVTWDETTVSEGMALWVEDENLVYVYNGTSWVVMTGGTSVHNSLSGIQGGDTDEYFHFTSAQHTGLSDLLSQISAVSDGYIPVQDVAIGYKNSYIKQGIVDPAGSATPIISYNSTPFITPPTLAPNLLYQQYAPGMVHSVTDLGEALPVYMYQFNGIFDSSYGITLLNDGWASCYLFSRYSLSYYPTDIGTAGVHADLDISRAWGINDMGPGLHSILQLGHGFRNGLVNDFDISFSDKGPQVVFGFDSISLVEADQTTIHFAKNHEVFWIKGPTVDTEPLGQIRFHGNQASGTANWSLYDARIRAVQNGAAATSGVPVNMYFETSDGTAWNTNQFVLQSDGDWQLGLIKQGHVDVAGSNTPIISYNSTPFFTPPTGLTTHLLYQQYHPLMVHGVIDLSGLGLYPTYTYEFNGVINDTFDGMVLTTDGYATVSVFSMFGYQNYGTVSGLAGDTCAFDVNRMFGMNDNGPGTNAVFMCGDGYRANCSSQPSANFQLGLSGSGNGPLFAIGLSSTATTENDQGTLLLGKNHGTLADIMGATIDGEPLGQIRFAGINTATPYSNTSSIDARIRAVQNGAAATDGVPVDLFLEASTGTAWNSYQLALKTGGQVNIGTNTVTQKLHVAGDIDIDSGYGIRINNTATSGQYLKGDGTRFVSSAIQSGDMPNHNVSTNFYPYAYSANVFSTGKIYNGPSGGLFFGDNPYIADVDVTGVFCFDGGTTAPAIAAVAWGSATPNWAFMTLGGTKESPAPCGIGTAPFYVQVSAAYGSGGIEETDLAFVLFTTLTTDWATNPHKAQTIFQGCEGRTQIILHDDGSVAIGDVGKTQKLHVAGDIDVDSGYGIRINNTATSGYVLVGDGTRFVPSATATPSAHNTLSTSHGDTTTDSVVRGDLITGQGSTAKWTRLAKGTSGRLLTCDANDVKWDSLANIGVQPLDADLTAIAGISIVRGMLISAQGASPAWAGLAISAPAATYMNYIGTANGDTEPGYKVLFDATVPGTIVENAAAATGSSTVAARRDHTHGAPMSWAPTAHNLLSASHADVLTNSVIRGDILVGNLTPKWARLAKGTSGLPLVAGATDVAYTALSNSGIGNLGTSGTISKFAATGLTDSSLTDNGTTVKTTLALGVGTSTPTVAGRVQCSEALGVGAAPDVNIIGQFTKNQDALTGLTLTNTNAHAASRTIITAGADASSLELMAFSSLYTSYNGVARIRAYNTGGLQICNASNTDMLLQTNGTTRVTIAAAGHVLVGGGQDDSLMHIQSGSAGTVTAIAGTVLTVESSDVAYLNFLTPDDKLNGIRFGKASDNSAAYLLYSPGSGNLQMAYGGTAFITMAGSQITLEGSSGADWLDCRYDSATQVVFLKDLNELRFGNTYTSPRAKIYSDGTHLVFDVSTITDNIVLKGSGAGGPNFFFYSNYGSDYIAKIQTHTDSTNRWLDFLVNKGAGGIKNFLRIGTLAGTDGILQLNPEGDSNVNPELRSIAYGNDAGYYGILSIGHVRGSVASPAALAGSDALGRINFYGRDGTNIKVGGSLRAKADASWSGAADCPTLLEMWVCPNSSDTQSRVMFWGSGLVSSMVAFSCDSLSVTNGAAFKTFSQAAQPSGSDLVSGEMAFWVDTDAGNRLYLIYNHGGTYKKVELT